MTDLGRRFASLDRVPAPDLWHEIEVRADAHGAVSRVTPIVTPAPKATPQPAGRSPMVYLAAAAMFAALVAGALLVGSRLLDEPTPQVIQPSSAPSLAVVPSPTAAATPNASPSPEATATPAPTMAGHWFTGRELADALSAAFGYQWSPQVDDTGAVSLVSGRIRISAPTGGPAVVDVADGVDAAAEVGQDADRVAQLLAPDAATWLRDGVSQGLAAEASVSVTADTANDGSVGVDVVRDPYGDHMDVWFSPRPTVWNEPNGTGLVVASEAGVLWAVNRDGSGAGPLLRGADDPRRRGAAKVGRILGWTPDGSRLYYLSGGNVLWTDASGSKPVLVARGTRDGGLCPASATVDATCDIAHTDKLQLSSDGTRLAYPIDADPGPRTLGILDIATGQVARIAFAPAARDCEGPFGDASLVWSPDGTQLVRGGSVGPRVDGWCQAAIFAVNVDGSGTRRITPSMVHATEPRWSQDGTNLLFTAVTPRSAWNGNTDATAIPIDLDIYSIRPDGSGLTALTSDGVSSAPFVMRDGRIVFVRRTHPAAAGKLWIMDADGANATRLDATIPAMTAAGCVVCDLPNPLGGSEPDPEVMASLGIPDRSGGYWQPMPGDRP